MYGDKRIIFLKSTNGLAFHCHTGKMSLINNRVSLAISRDLKGLELKNYWHAKMPPITNMKHQNDIYRRL